MQIYKNGLSRRSKNEKSMVRRIGIKKGSVRKFWMRVDWKNIGGHKILIGVDWKKYWGSLQFLDRGISESEKWMIENWKVDDRKMKKVGSEKSKKLGPKNQKSWVRKNQKSWVRKLKNLASKKLKKIKKKKFKKNKKKLKKYLPD